MKLINRIPDPQFMKFYKENSFLISILLAVLVGSVVGAILRQYDLSNDAVSVIAYPGELFLRALKLIVLPFIICCIIVGCATLNIKYNKFIAIRVIVYFFLTSLFNVILGIMLALIVKPGSSEIQNKNASVSSEALSLMDGLLDVGRNLIAENIFESTFQQTYTVYKMMNVTKNGTTMEITKKLLKTRFGTNTLGIIFFCVLFGCILGTMETQKKILVKFFSSIYDVLQKMLLGVIWFTPLCVASIICSKIISVPDLWNTFQQIGLFVITIIFGLLFYQLIVAQLIYFIIVKKNPFLYYLKIMPAIMTGFATASKSASLPVMFKVMDDINMNTKITKFVLPIGTINLNGSAQFMGMAVVFLTQLEGITLGIDQIITLGLASTFASMSSAAVPSAAIVMVTMLCSIVNTPVDNIALLLSVDWLIDRFRTATNVLGDLYTVAVVQQLSEKELNQENASSNKTAIEMKTEKQSEDVLSA